MTPSTMITLCPGCWLPLLNCLIKSYTGSFLIVLTLKLFTHQIISTSVHFSDIVVKLSSRDIRAHRFVLAARSNSWTDYDLSQSNELDLTGKHFFKSST